MEDSIDRDEPSPRVLAELSALADGTLKPERAAALREQIARSPELSARYEREQQAIRALAVARTVRAPDRLRASIEAKQRQAERRPRARVRLPRLGTAWATAAVAALAVIGVALALLLPAGTPGGPSVSEAASLALRGASMAPPSPGGAGPAATLNRGVEEIYFPNWSRRLGWSATGQRVDKLGGRTAITVYYTRGGRRIAYTIVAAPELKLPNSATHWVNGTQIRGFTLGERRVVTWRRDGQTCVLSGVGVPASVLERLAAWRAPGSTA